MNVDARFPQPENGYLRSLMGGPQRYHARNVLDRIGALGISSDNESPKAVTDQDYRLIRQIARDFPNPCIKPLEQIVECMFPEKAVPCINIGEARPSEPPAVKRPTTRIMVEPMNKYDCRKGGCGIGRRIPHPPPKIQGIEA